MNMTMRVYDVDSKTGQVVRERGRVAVQLENGRDGPIMSSTYPPCQCRKCRAKVKSR